VALLSDSEASVRDAAGRSLARKGAAAVPALLKAFGTVRGDPRVQVKRLLGQAGAAAAPGLVALRVTQSPGWIQADAEEVLASMGDAAVPALVEAMRSGKRDVRYQVVYVLTRIKTSAATAALLEALRDESPRAAFLELVRRLDRPLTDRLITQLGGDAGGGRHFLLELLGYSSEARVIPVLLDNLADDCSTQHKHVHLIAILSHGAPGFQAVAEGLLHRNARVRDALLRSLAFEVTSLDRMITSTEKRAGATFKAWAKALATGLRQALGAAAVRKHLQGLLRERDPEVAYLAAQILVFAGALPRVTAHENAYLAHLLRRLPGLKDPDAIISTQARIGGILWTRSCPIRDHFGVCARERIVPVPGRKTPQIVLERVQRDPRLVKDAAARFEAVGRAWNDGRGMTPLADGDPDQRARWLRVREDVALARVMALEPQLEDLLHVEFPKIDPCNPGPRAKALRQSWNARDPQLKAWRLADAYRKAASLPIKLPRDDPGFLYHGLIAHSRIGMILENRVAQLALLPTASACKDAKLVKAHEDWIQGLRSETFPASVSGNHYGCIVHSEVMRWRWDGVLSCDIGYYRTRSYASEVPGEGNARWREKEWREQEETLRRSPYPRHPKPVDE
jgi:HEAT repeat protein